MNSSTGPHQYRIPFNVLSFDKDRMMMAIGNVLDRKDFILGREVGLFEESLQINTGLQAVAVGNGTQALELALRALELPPGSKVVTVGNAGLPPVIAIARAGLSPYFCDVDDRGLMDPESLKEILGHHPDVKAILPVHLYGQIINLKEFDFFDGDVVEDACQGFGSHSYHRYNFGDRPGSIVAMSFYPSKVLGAFGDGGAVLSKDGYYSDRIRCLRNFGVHPAMSVADGYGLYEGSMNSRMDTIQAAILLEGMKDQISNQPIREWLSFQYWMGLRDGFTHRPYQRFENHHLFTIRVPNRHKLITVAKNRGIELRVHYQMPSYHNRDVPKVWCLPKTEKICKEIVSLPLYPSMSAEDVREVISVVREYQNA